MMKRLFPAPLLSAALWAMWLVLNDSLAPAHLLLGAAIGWALPWLVSPLRPAGRWSSRDWCCGSAPPWWSRACRWHAAS